MEAEPTLYDLLGVRPDSSKAEITKAFRLMALQVHPDKNPDDPEAAKNFQLLNRAYKVLSDPSKRQLYDVTGDADHSEEFIEAYKYYREIYHQITPQVIDDFSVTYKGGPMEAEDLMEFYKEHQGDMTDILYFIPLSEPSDLPRFWEFFDEKIQLKELPKKAKYKKTRGKAKALEDGESEVIEKKKSLKAIQGDSDLVAAIRANKANRGNFLDNLEAKYSKPKRKKRSK